MESKMKLPFDPVTFLGKVGAGKTILNYQRNQTVFEQGDVADTVFSSRNRSRRKLSRSAPIEWSRSK
jgi:hypothetical protein